MILCTTILMCCKKDPKNGTDPDDPCKTNVKGIFSLNDCPDVGIEAKDEFPEGTAAGTGKSSSLKAGENDDSGEQLSVNQYRFKLVAEMDRLNINRDGKTYPTQATHVKITEIVGNVGYAYVTYNFKNESGDPKNDANVGGIVVYKFVVTPGSVEENATKKANVEVEALQSLEMPTSQLNAIDYDGGNKLYVCGATDEPGKIGLDSDGTYRNAFYMVLEIDPTTMKIVDTDPVIKQLTSFQATSICKRGDKVYITTGDGTNGSNGGLYIFDANTNNQLKFIERLEHARSVDADASSIYLFQANPASVTKYDLSGNNPLKIYDRPNQAKQEDAKSEILAWKDYLFVAENKTGLKMLFKSGDVNEALDPPNKTGEFREGGVWNEEKDVTNSVSMNSDKKIMWRKDRGVESSFELTSDLLFVANGEQGLYWYDITKSKNTGDTKDYIALPGFNSILRGTGSANFVTSKGNVVFVADGLGGLKVLYIGINSGDAPPIVGKGCDTFMSYFYYGDAEKTISPLFPEANSVFRTTAAPIVKQLFQLPTVQAARDVTLNYIDIINDTKLYITFLIDGAGWYNALGYFVIPASANVARTDVAEYTYFNNYIKNDLCETGTSNLKDKYVIFKSIHGYNAPSKSTKGPMLAGDRYSIGNGQTFKKGDRVVLFMCPNGYNSTTGKVVVDFKPTSGGSVNTKCIFFMHKYFNGASGSNITYSTSYGNFKGQQMNTVYSADCRSMILFIEDWHVSGTDVDFNDIIFTLSDNPNDYEVENFKAPKWAIEQKADLSLRIFETKEIDGVTTAF